MYLLSVKIELGINYCTELDVQQKLYKLCGKAMENSLVIIYKILCVRLSASFNIYLVNIYLGINICTKLDLQEKLYSPNVRVSKATKQFSALDLCEWELNSYFILQSILKI